MVCDTEGSPERDQSIEGAAERHAAEHARELFASTILLSVGSIHNCLSKSAGSNQVLVEVLMLKNNCLLRPFSIHHVF
jgi:hypothetical protein